ncbi:MAG: insulinase family protein [Sphingomonadales bacterium]|nr:insulinase family protein [Sphingomonadales bacterium]
MGDDAEPARPAGVNHVETVTAAPGEIAIPYSKYRLDNGLTVILHTDQSDPVIHVDVTYHVGSGREEIGKSGFAHFFEHMMFQGSENVADDQHIMLVTEMGGGANGTTNTDRTNYYQTIPANQLERVLWLEADRMGFLLDAVTQEKFEVQRETVKNERAQSYDNRPYGLLYERVGEAMYPEGHPYSWSTIGYVEDLNRVNVNDLKKFFLRWYGPNNAVLTIGGDIDQAETLAWVEKYFGPIRRGPEVGKPTRSDVALDADRYISMEDDVALPLLYMSWPTVYENHEDKAALDVLSEIMANNKTSLLYKNIVKKGLAVEAGGRHSCRELHCQFTLYALASPASDAGLADIEEIMRASFAEFEVRGVLQDDLTRVKAATVSRKIHRLESIFGKVSRLAAYETFQDDPNYFAEEIAAYENVTKEDVLRVYGQYIKGRPAVIMSIVPKGQPGAIAAPDTWQRYERTLPDYDVTTESDLDLRIAEDAFDRSVMPAAGADRPLTLPATWRSALENGVEVLGMVNGEAPTTVVRVNIKAGQKNESLEKLGLAGLTAAMLNERTTESTAEDLTNRLAKLGSSVVATGGDTFTALYIRSLTRHLDETLAIAAEKLLKPAFSEEDFDRLKDRTLQNIASKNKEPATIASNVLRKLLYGEDHILGHPSIGIRDSVANLTLEDVRQFYAGHYSAAVAGMVVVSDLPQSTIMEKLAVFGGWPAREVAPPELAAMPALDGNTIYLVDKPGAAQSQIRIGKRALTFDATGEYYRAGLMNHALGGFFSSRININLREDKGYSYGARSYFYGDADSGSFTATAAVRPDATGPALTEFYKEIGAYAAKGITAEELAFTKSAVGQADARRYESRNQKLNLLANLQIHDLDSEVIDEQQEILAGITKQDIDVLAAKHLNLEEMVTVVVGDKETILPGLAELGLPIKELDERGVPLSGETGTGPKCQKKCADCRGLCVLRP